MQLMRPSFRPRNLKICSQTVFKSPREKNSRFLQIASLQRYSQNEHLEILKSYRTNITNKGRFELTREINAYLREKLRS